MIQSLKNTAWTAAVAVALTQTPFAARAVTPDKSAGASSTDPVVASGKNFTIKRSQVDDAFLNVAARAAARGRTIPDDMRAEVRSNVLNYLILNQILVQRATDTDKAQARQDVDKQLALARSNAPSPQMFDAQIKASGMTMDQFRNKAVDEEVCQLVIARETVTDSQIKKFYDDNPTKFDMPEQVHAAHILISTQDPTSGKPLSAEQKKEKLKLANEVLAKAQKGADFAALAKQYSDDPGSKNNGGEYTFSRGKMVPEFEDAAFALKKPGDITDHVVETQYGYHIVKLLGKVPAGKAPFNTVTNEIRNYLVAQAEPAYSTKLKAEYNVKIVEPAGGQTPGH